MRTATVHGDAPIERTEIDPGFTQKQTPRPFPAGELFEISGSGVQNYQLR